TADIEALVAAIAASYGGGSVAFVCSPGQAAALKFWSGDRFDYPILPSSALPAGTVIARESANLVASIAGGVPTLSTSTGATLHFESDTPQDITGGSPSPAAPVRSMFQVDAVALRMVVQGVDWAMRAPHAQWMTSVNW